eukprot:109950_1
MQQSNIEELANTLQINGHFAGLSIGPTDNVWLNEQNRPSSQRSADRPLSNRSSIMRPLVYNFQSTDFDIQSRRSSHNAINSIQPAHSSNLSVEAIIPINPIRPITPPFNINGNGLEDVEEYNHDVASLNTVREHEIASQDEYELDEDDDDGNSFGHDMSFSGGINDAGNDELDQLKDSLEMYYTNIIAKQKEGLLEEQEEAEKEWRRKWEDLKAENEQLKKINIDYMNDSNSSIRTPETTDSESASRDSRKKYKKRHKKRRIKYKKTGNKEQDKMMKMNLLQQVADVKATKNGKKK